MTTRWRLALALAALAALAAPVAAQQPAPSATVSAPGDSTLPPFERPNGMLLRIGTTVYDLATTRGGEIASLGVRTVQVTESSVAGQPAWLITESRTGSPVETSDSLYLSRNDLLPQRWVATSGRAQLSASFARDSLFGALQSYQGRSSLRTAAAAGTLVTPAMMERVIEMLPLRAGYRARASLLVIELGAPRTVAAELVVDHDDALQIDGRVAECWVVAVRAGSSEQRVWVTKEAPRVVRSEQAFPGGVLTAVARP